MDTDTIINVCAKIHNVCIDKNVPVVSRYHHDWIVGDSDFVYLNPLPTAEELRTEGGVRRAYGTTTGSRRKQMTDQLDVMGVRRTALSTFTKA